MNDSDKELFEVRFFFPYDAITLDKVSLADMVYYKAKVHEGEPFETKNDAVNGSTFLINPAMLTYVKVSNWLPF